MRTDLRRIGLAGSPNAGKTTLYNWLTGSKAKTVNYPGATVEYASGESLDVYGDPHIVIDTPGTYSVFPKTPEEKVTENILFTEDHKDRPELLIVVVDGTQFIRQCALVQQLQESGWPVIVALTMSDVLKKDGWIIKLDVLSQELNAPVAAIDGRLGGGVKELMELARTELEQLNVCNIQPIESWNHERFEKAFAELKEIHEKCILPTPQNSSKACTQKLDLFFLHPVFGITIFLLIMATLFSSIFWMADPIMGFIDEGFAWAATTVYSLGPNSLWADLAGNGIIAGFGALIIFVPQIFILFLGLNLLEDTGYLARAATLVDKPLSLIGLNGRSFVPLLSGHACSVPAMMTARTIPNRKERWLTLFILPLMTCSARLPVYALLLAFLFDSALTAGLWLTAIYFGSFILGGITSLIAEKFVDNEEERSFFLLELPHYRRPRLTTVLKLTFEKTKAFILRAGPIIFILSILIWASTTFPNYTERDDAIKLQSSYAAQAGQWIEPIMEPIGLDWRSGVGIITSVAAREVFVSTMALVFNVADDGEDRLQASLLNAMKSAKRKDGKPLFTVASIAGLIIFYMIALQCIATVSIARKESGSWSFAVFQLVSFNIAAYLLAFATYNLLA